MPNTAIRKKAPGEGNDSKARSGNGEAAHRVRALTQGRNKRQGSPEPGCTGKDCGAKDAVGVGIHLLAKELKSKSLFELWGASSNKEKELMSHVSSEADQLQAICDLWQIVKDNTNAKAPPFPEDTEPLKVLQWMLRKLGTLAKGFDWTIDTWMRGKKKRFCFVIYDYWSNFYINHEIFFLPLDFLPALKSRDELLHDLIIDVVARVNTYCGVPFWDEDGDYSSLLPIINAADNGTISRQLRNYKFGVAQAYLRQLKASRVGYNALKNRILDYKSRDSNSCRQSIVSSWLREGLEIAKDRMSLEPFSHEWGYLKKKPIAPARLYKFSWSIHKADVLHASVKAAMKREREEAGLQAPFKFTLTKPGEKVIHPTQRYNTADGRFPVWLENWMRTGVNHFSMVKQFRGYYYKTPFNSKETPTDALLRKIEEGEIEYI